MALKKTLRICTKGHRYEKSSDCPTCPICEKEKKPKNGPFSSLSAPAIRALQNNGINNLKQLSKYTEEEILQLHGIGKSSLPKLITQLAKVGLSFKSKTK